MDDVCPDNDSEVTLRSKYADVGLCLRFVPADSRYQADVGFNMKISKLSIF